MFVEQVLLFTESSPQPSTKVLLREQGEKEATVSKEKRRKFIILPFLEVPICGIELYLILRYIASLSSSTQQASYFH